MTTAARSRTAALVAVLVLVVLAVVVAQSARHDARTSAARASTTGAAGKANAGSATGGASSGSGAGGSLDADALPQVPSGWTVLATTSRAIPRYTSPGGRQDGWVPGHWHSAVSTLPVIAGRKGWLEVRLAQRPNESTAWVLRRDVTLTRTPYRIVINLATTHLDLYRLHRRLMSAPAGIGTPLDPTPPGRFFVAFFAAPPNPAYGAFVMVTSAHSNVITDWERSGDGMIAIHGPLGSDALIGTTGARISHGCVRLHEADLLRLRDVPVGSPVDIVA